MADDSKSKRRVARLGRGLSSLMAQDKAGENGGTRAGGGGGAVAEKQAPAAATELAPDPEPAERDEAAPRPQAQASSSAPASTEAATGAQPAGPDSDAAGDQLVQLAITAIRPNPQQPRQSFDESALNRLAHSLASDGMMQPIIVRAIIKHDKDISYNDSVPYELVAGERRWRAAKLAGLTHVPALIRRLDDQQLAEWALIENLQREDLNPIERAEAFDRLIDQFSLSHEQIAERVGVQRSTVTNTLRLLALEQDVRQLIRDGLLSPGQAKALAGIEQPGAQRELALQAVREGWSVRQVEAAARQASPAAGGGGGKPKSKKTRRRSAHLADLEKQIAETLGTKVRLTAGSKKGTGTLAIEFYSLEQFEGVLERLGVKTE